MPQMPIAAHAITQPDRASRHAIYLETATQGPVKVLTIDDVTRITGWSRSTVYRRWRAKKIEARNVDGRMMISDRSLRDYIKQCPVMEPNSGSGNRIRFRKPIPD
jgi:hypothetical protein